MKVFLGIFRQLTNLFRSFNQSECSAGVLALICGSGLDRIDAIHQQLREAQTEQKAVSNLSGAAMAADAHPSVASVPF
jgi:hypothetical protein